MTGIPTVACVVEGHGEVQALPILVRRIAAEILGIHVIVTRPHRVKRTQMRSGAVLENAVHTQNAYIDEAGGVLILADADDDCAVKLATELRGQVASTGAQVTVAVREFESWFLAAVESLRAHRSVRPDAAYNDDPEKPRGAKAALNARMLEQYRETRHQAAFAAMIDLTRARRARSFEHLITCVERLTRR